MGLQEIIGILILIFLMGLPNARGKKILYAD